MSYSGERTVPVMDWTVLTTHCRCLWSWVEKFPNQTDGAGENALGYAPLDVPQNSEDSGVLESLQEVQSLCLFDQGRCLLMFTRNLLLTLFSGLR